MRSFLLLALAVLGACSAPPEEPDAEWTRLQQERLQRMYAARRPDAALEGVRQHDPREDLAEPRHIDQIEPPSRRTGATAGKQDSGRPDPRPFHAPSATTNVAIGAGTIGVRVHGSLLDDSVDATFLHAAVETTGGAGLHVDAWSSDGDLFAGLRINDGVDPAAADTTVSGVDVFPHLVFAPVVDDFRLPLRAGVFVDWQSLDHHEAVVEREFLSIGPRVLFEPAWSLLGDGRDVLDLVLRAGGDAGVAWFSEEFVGGDDRDTTARLGGEAGASLRARIGALQAEVGYRLQHTAFGAVDSDLFGRAARTDVQRQQVFVGFGVTW